MATRSSYGPFRSAFTIAFFLVVTAATAAFAEETARLIVPIDGEFDAAIGIIVSNGETKQVRVAAPQKRDDQSVIVEVPYSSSDKKSGALVTALVTLKSGAIALADMVALQESYPDNAFSDLPMCPTDQDLPPLSEAQLGNLKRLVEIRSQRRAVLQTKLARLMQGKSLEKLRQLEKGFGTGTGVPISPALLPFELIDRLSRLKQAISTYEANRNKK